MTWRFQPVPLLAHLAAHVGSEMNYVTAVLLSTSAHPVQLAEDICTLDAMCGGRLRVGIGLGWMPHEFEAFGVDQQFRVSRLEELITATWALLTQDEVDFSGRHFTFRQAKLVARPVQHPSPPIWLGASAEAAVLRAARMADSWTISGISSVEELRPQLAAYRGELGRLGRAVPAERPINRWVYVAEDRQTAIDEAMPVLAEWHRKRGAWGWVQVRAEDGTLSDAVLGSGRWIIGDPQDASSRSTCCAASWTSTTSSSRCRGPARPKRSGCAPCDCWGNTSCRPSGRRAMAPHRVAIPKISTAIDPRMHL